MKVRNEAARSRTRNRRWRHSCRAAIIFLLLNAGVVSSAKSPAVGAEFWIANRSDDRAGSGGKSDPFDGSTQEKFDGVMNEVPPGAAIHLGIGTFITKGIHAKDGWRISGRGKDRTTLKLADDLLPSDPPQPGRSVVYQYDFQGFLRYFELRDLTVDCNRAGQRAFRENLSGYFLEAWAIAAKSAKIVGVRALGTWSNPGEGFPCRVYHDGSKDRGDRIEISDCENLHPIGSLTAIAVFDQGGGLVSGTIRRCLVTDHASGAAFGAGGWRNFEIAENETRNVAVAITIDTHNYRDVRIHGNRFRNCLAWGVLCNGAGVYDGIRIYDNLFEMGAKAGPCIVTGNARIETEIRDNTIVCRGRPAPLLSRGAHTIARVEGNTVRQRKTNER